MKSCLPRNGFWEALAWPGHLLRALEDTNKSGSRTLSSITGIRALSMFRGGTPQLVSEKLLSTRQLTDHHSSVSDSGWLPISQRRKRFAQSPAARISSTDCRSPSCSPLPSLLHHNASLPTCHVSLPCLLTIWSCLTPPPFLAPPQPRYASPTTTQLRDASSYAFEHRLALGNRQSVSFTFSGQRLVCSKLVFPYLCPPSVRCLCVGSALPQG